MYWVCRGIGDWNKFSGLEVKGSCCESSSLVLAKGSEWTGYRLVGVSNEEEMRGEAREIEEVGGEDWSEVLRTTNTNSLPSKI